MANSITPSLVSLWAHPTDTGTQHFLCSGFFVSAGLVLSVKHVLQGRGADAVWVRARVSEAQAFRIKEVVSIHPDHDAALLRLDTMPMGAKALAIDPHAEPSGGEGAYALHGYFEGRYETPSALTIKNFSATDLEYLCEPRHPKGHSGSAVCLGQQAWGMTTAHLTDPTADRGFVLGLHQLWTGWLDAHLPDHRSSSSPLEPLPGASPTPVAALLLGDRLQRINKLRACLAHGFSKGFDAQAQTVVPLLDSGLPQEIEHALQSDQPDLGKRMVHGLNTLQKRLGQQLKSGELVLAEVDRARLKEALREAMLTHATKLCIDPERLPRNGTPDFIAHLPVRSRPGAALVGRASPHLSMDVFGAGADDRHGVNYAIESGEGDDLILDLMAQLWRHLRPAEPQPSKRDDLAFELQRMLFREADNERKRLIVLKCPSDAAHVGRFDAIKDWLLGMHLGVVHYTDEDGGVFGFIAEADLIGAIDSFLERFNNLPWAIA